MTCGKVQTGPWIHYPPSKALSPLNKKCCPKIVYVFAFLEAYAFGYAIVRLFILYMCLIHD